MEHTVGTIHWQRKVTDEFKRAQRPCPVTEKREHRTVIAVNTKAGQSTFKHKVRDMQNIQRQLQTQ